MGHPILYAHLNRKHFTAAFLRYGTLFVLEGYKHPFLIYKKLIVSSYMGRPYYMHTSYETIYCIIFEIWDIIRFRGV